MQTKERIDAKRVAFWAGGSAALLLFGENWLVSHFAKRYMPAGIMLVLFPLLAGIITSAALYRMLSTGKIYPTRRLLFVAFTIITILAWGSAVIHNLGTLWEPQTIRVEKGKPVLPNGKYFMRPPPCPIAVAIVAPAYFLRGLMPYPTTAGFLVGMFLFWLISVLLVGRSFCSWLCPFGGIDDFFSQLRKRAKLSLKKVEREWLNFRIVFFLLLVGAAVFLGKAVFDEWLCPIQTFYTPPMLHNQKGILKAFILTGGAAAFLVLLPLLTKKRFFCTYICPVGGINGYLGFLTPIQVRRDESRCIGCLRCEKKCPLLVKFNASGFKGDLQADCTRCGECIDICEDRALNYVVGAGGIKADTFVRSLFCVVLVNIMLFSASGGPALVLQFLSHWRS